MAIATWEAYTRIGPPEGNIPLAELVIYLATAPKSNAGYVALGEAMAAARQTGSLMPPAHILNAPTKMMKELGYGKGYAYDHDDPDGFSGKNYFPDGMPRTQFYRPHARGFERDVIKRLAYWQKLRDKKNAGTTDEEDSP
jgi:putative ATPase